MEYVKFMTGITIQDFNLCSYHCKSVTSDLGWSRRRRRTPANFRRTVASMLAKFFCPASRTPAPAPAALLAPDSCQYVDGIFLSGAPDAGAGAGDAGQLPVCSRKIIWPPDRCLAPDKRQYELNFLF